MRQESMRWSLWTDAQFWQKIPEHAQLSGAVPGQDRRYGSLGASGTATSR